MLRSHVSQCALAALLLAAPAAAQNDNQDVSEIDDAQLRDLEDAGCPTCGSCSGMFTANSMNCIMEALGLALPGNGSITAVDPRRKDLARRAADRIVALVDEDAVVARRREAAADAEDGLAQHRHRRRPAGQQRRGEGQYPRR